MSKLKNNKAFNSSELTELMDVGKKTLEVAKDVSDDIKRCLNEITTQYNQIPSAAQENDLEKAVKTAEKRIEKGKYNIEKNRLQNAVKKLEQAVPQYDKACAGQIKKLSAVCDRLYTRITDLESFLQKGKLSLSPDRFQEELEEYQKRWEEEGETLDEILEAVKAGLKGMELMSCMYSSDPVNLSTGNFIYDKTDFKVKGEPGLSFRRFYNAMEKRKGVMGKGWIHNYELFLLTGENGFRLYLEDGKEEYYEEDEEGNLVSVRGSQGRLTRTENGYQYEKMDKSRYHFDEQGRYISYENAKGARLFLSYNEMGKLVRVEEEAKEGTASFLVYAYHEDGQLAMVTDHTGRSITLCYQNGILSKVDTLEGTSYEYHYDQDGRLTQVVNAAGIMTVKNTYDREGRTKKQIFPDGSRMRYRYMEADGQVELTERNGAKIIYCHDALYRNTKTIYEDGEELYTYNRNNQRTSYTDKNGNRTVYAYDDRGHLTKVVDALGNRTTFTYNGEGKLLKVSLNGKEKMRNYYDCAGNLVKTTDALQHVTEFEYDHKKRPIRIIQADGSDTTIEYDKKGNVKKLIDYYGNTTIYCYDDLNRVIRTMDGNGNITSYDYNEKDELIAVTNAEGNTRKYQYNHGGKVTKIVDFDGSVTEMTYNCLNKVAESIDPEGNKTTYAYDKMWNVSSVENPEGGKTEYIYNLQNLLETVVDAEGNRVEYTYDACGNRTQVKGKNGEETRFVYDALNRIVRMEEADGIVTEFVYDANGNITKTYDSIGNIWHSSYNALGKRIQDVDKLGNTICYEYDALGNVTKITDAAGRITEYIYRKGGRLEKAVYPNGTWECFNYDNCGNIVKRERADGYSIEYVYDCLNRLVRLTSSTGQIQDYKYNMVGNVIEIIDAKGNKTIYDYDKVGNLIGVIDAEDGETNYRYNRNGYLSEILQYGRKKDDEEQRRIRYKRDKNDRVIVVEDVLGRKEFFAYDGCGRIIEKKDREDNVTKYSYNNSGQIQHITYGDGKEVHFNYNALRQLQEIKDWLGTMMITYDDGGCVSSISDHKGKEVKYYYGVHGEREKIIYPNGKMVHYEYDELLRLSRLNSGEQTAVYEYDNLGRIAERITSEGIITDYDYDSNGFLSKLVHRDDEGVIESFQYGYDMMGNRIREERYRKELIEENGVYTYKYDRMNRLIETQKDGKVLRDYHYDGFGNRKELIEGGIITHYKYNALNQLVFDTNGSIEHIYEYDNRGNLIRENENGQMIHSYEFDARNRIVRSFDNKGNLSEYDYNGLGYRIGMKQKETKASQDIYNKETKYILDFTKYYYNLLQQEQDEVVQSYVWDDELVFMEENGVGYRYLNDIQGSTMQLLDSTKTSKVHYSYDEFGCDLSYNQGEFQPFGYTGHLKDNMTGLYYAQAREYDAQSGRFISEDIVKGNTVSPTTLNAYGYCSNNPLIYVDYDGREKTFILGEECEYIENDSNMNPLLWERTQKKLIASGDYECVGFDENGTPLIRKKQKHYIKALVKDTQDESMDVTDVKSIEEVYDTMTDAVDVANETTNVITVDAIKEQPRPNNIGRGTWDKRVAKELASQGKFYSKFSKFIKKAGVLGVVLDGIVGVIENIDEDTWWPKLLIDLGVDLLVGLILLGAGTVIATKITAMFVAIGTITLPLIGTVGLGGLGAVAGVVASVAIVGLLAYLLNMRGKDGKSFIDHIKDFIWYTATGEYECCSVGE